MYSNTLPERSLWPIVIGVLFFHALACLGSFYLVPPIVQKPPSSKKLLVRTVKLNPSKKAEIHQVKNEIAQAEPAVPTPVVQEAPQVIESPPQEVAAPVPVKEVKKEEIKKEPVKEAPKEVAKETVKEVAKPTPVKPAVKVEAKPTAKPVAKTTVTKPVEKKEVKTPPKAAPTQNTVKSSELDKKRELLAKAMGSLAKVETKTTKTSSSSANRDRETIEMPKEMGAFHADTLSFEGSDQGLSIKELGYRDELAMRLKLLLKLPEYGVVKLKLILARSGKVTQVEVISSASEVNRKHLMKVLPTLNFPSFGDNFSKESSHLFQITLSSD